MSTSSPDALICTGFAAANWKVYKEAYNDFATTTEQTDKGKEIQTATLKMAMGRECRQILSCLDLNNEDNKKPNNSNKILEKFEEYFTLTRNVLYEQYLFHSAQQQQNETVDQYIIRLQHLAETCKFRVLHDKMLRYCLILGYYDKGVRARLF